MRLNLHQKIVLGAILPASLIVILFAVVTLLKAQQAEGESRLNQTIFDARKLALGFARVLGDSADEAVASARLASLRPDLPDREYQDWLASQVQDNPSLYGAGVTFWPAHYGGRRKDLYVHRDGGRLIRLDQSNTYDGADGSHEWFTLAQQAGKPVWTPPYFDAGAGNAWMVSYSVPFFRAAAGGPAFDGVALIDIRLDRLRALAEGRRKPEDRLLVLDEAGRIVFADQSRYLGRPYTDFAAAGSGHAQLLLRARGSDSGGEALAWPELGAANVGWARIMGSGWTLVLARPSLQGGAALTPGQLRLALLVSIAAISSMLAFFLLARVYTRPLRDMLAAAQRISRGETVAAIAYKSEDELGALVQSFETMASQLAARELVVSSRSRELAARVREQQVLYRIADLLGWIEVGFAEMLRRAAELLPEAWVEPEQIAARINLRDQHWLSSGFRESSRGLFAPIEADGEAIGGVWVFALDDASALEASHQQLIEGVAQQLGLAWRRERAQTQLAGLNQELEQRVEQRTAVLRQTERLLRDITNSMPGVVFQIVRPLQGKLELRFVSTGVQSLWGLSREQALADCRLLMERIHPDDRPDYGRLAEAVQKGGLFSHTYRIAPGDGSQRWVRSAAHVSCEADGSYLLNGYWTDVTEQKTLELALDQARREADAANEAKSRFLANMSHEIRTPMNAIIGLTHLANQQSSEPRVREQLNKVEDSAKTLLGLLNDILDFSKIEAGQLQVEHIAFDPRRLLERVEGLMAPRAAEKGLLFTVRRTPELPRDLLGDPLRLSQVLLNFLSNALKFTEAGSVTLEVGVVAADRQRVLLSFAVQDTGLGIDEAELPRLFSAFTQADSSTTRRYGGTGLGLSISQQLVGLMGGEISVQSRRGEGSRFSFTLGFGRADPDWRHESGEALAADPDVLLGARVLVVDDNHINLEIASALLEQSGVTVVTAINGAEAIERLGDAPFDAVLMDLQMPEMDGYTATAIIRANSLWAELPIIAMTANAMSGDRERCLQAGMNDHVPKPFEPAELRQTLARWLRRGRS